MSRPSINFLENDVSALIEQPFGKSDTQGLRVRRRPAELVAHHAGAVNARNQSIKT